MDIKNVYGVVIFTSAALTLRDAVLDAISKKINLSYANLSYADLRYADLSYADLRSADLRYADLSSADLSYADLSYANLSSANLSSADLSYADLRSADLSYADLSYANLSSADLRSADLSYADLSSANLSYADLSSANLSYAKNIEKVKNATLSFARIQFIPTTGAFIGWKKCKEGIVKLGISSDAKRSHGTERKCRASKAKCLEIYGPKGEMLKEAHSLNDPSFIYTVGKVIFPDSFDDNRWNTCGNGIHFYITREEAEAHG